MYIYIHTPTLTYIPTYMHAYIRTYTHTYTHTHIHAYIHTYTHTYTSGEIKIIWHMEISPGRVRSHPNSVNFRGRVGS